MAAYPPGPTRMVDLPAYGANSAPTDRMWVASAAVGFAAGAAADRYITLNDLLAEITRNITDVSVQFGDGVGATVSAAGKGKLRYNDTVGSFQVSENGAAYQNLLKGNGTATRVAFWTGTSSLGSDAAYYWDNTNKRLSVGVGTSPGAPVDVLAESVSAIAQQWRPNTGTMRAAIKLDGGPETFFGTTTAHNLHLITSDIQRLSIEATSGNVGVNKPTAIAAQLQVVANAATTKGLIVNSAPSTSVNLVEFYNDAALRFVFSNAGNLGIGLSGAGGATGSITFNGVTSGAVTVNVAAAAGTWTLTLPTDDGNAGQFLQTNGSGVTTWATATTSPASPVNSVQFNNAGAFGGSSNLLWDNSNNRLLLGVAVASGQAPLDVLADGTALAQQWRQNAGPLRVQMILDNVPEASLGTTTNHTFHLLSNNLQRLTVENGGLVGINKAAAVQAQLQVVSQDATTETLILNSAASPSVSIAEFYNDSSLRFAFSPAGNLSIGLSGAGGATGSITFNGVTSGAVTVNVAAAAGTWTLTLPTDDGNAGQFLQTNGSGVTTWATAGGGATINPTDTLIPYRSSSSAFSDSQLIRLSSAITELRNITTGTTAQTLNIYGTAANNTASAPTEYVRANHSATSTAINMVAEIATPSATAVAGINVNITASAAVAGASVAGAAAGGNVTITANNAARLTSGNANGGVVIFVDGAGVGTGVRGGFNFGGTASTDVKLLKFSNGFSSPSLLLLAGNGTASVGAFHAPVLSCSSSATGDSLSEIALVGVSGGRITVGSGGVIGFSSSASTNVATLDGNKDTTFVRAAANIFRVANGSTGAGGILIAPSTASITGSFTVLPDNATTNSIVTVARLGVNSTGTAADGFGAALSWSAETSTTNDTETGRFNVFWSTATHASRTSALSFTLSNNASLAEVMRLTTPSATVGSPFVLSIHDGTNPNVWTAGAFAAKLYLISPTLPAVGVAAHFSATALDAPQWQMLRGRGTNASPAAVQATDSLGNLEWWGQTNTSTNNVVAGARIRVSATENWSAGNNGCQMIFFTSNNAGTITERASLQPTGCFRIGATSGTTSTDTKLQIGNYASWNVDAVAAIYTDADDNKGLEIIGTATQTADLFRCFLDTVTPDKLTLTAGGRLTTHWLNWNGEARVTSQFDKTSDTTLANVTGLSINVVAGRTYSFKAILYTTSNVAGGVKAAIGGTATATAIRYEAVTFDNATVAAQTRATALGTTVGAVTAVTAAMIVITGTITVNAAGTLTVQFAQNASNAAASSVLVGSVLIADDVP